IRVHGAMGLSNQTPLAEMLTWSWVMGIGDGPNEVHLEAIAKMEVRDNDSAASVKHYLTPGS
ncbi:MAG: acyl-CoA dehydrogenase family protein, partial [Arenicellales bacterium]|nr:acyl-CoA dehydrogenase family protein [Arenicellales bacterium]